MLSVGDAEASPQPHIQWPCAALPSFEAAVAAAIEQRLPLHLTGDGSIALEHTVLVKGNDIDLSIVGCGRAGKSVLEGSGHSVFQVNGKRSAIHLENLVLQHATENNDKTSIGAAVFSSNNCRCHLVNCELSSRGGFGIWAVQQTRCVLEGCVVSSAARSGCVVFGSSKITIENSIVHSCFQHGICLRGDCELDVSNSVITDCGARAVYGYEGAQLRLSGCRIENTMQSLHAAVELLRFKRQGLESHVAGRRRIVGRKSGKPPSIVLTNVSFKGNNCTAIAAIGPDIDVVLNNCSRFDDHTNTYRPILEADVSRHASAAEDFGADSPPADFSRQAWEFHKDDQVWENYSPDISNWITLRYAECLGMASSAPNSSTSATEEAVAADRSHHRVMPAPYDKYKIDFLTLHQINIGTHFARKIRKV